MKRRAIDWPACAMNLAAEIPRERLHPAVLAWAEAPAAVRRTWAVALSGGGDSVALLLLLWAHWPQRRRRLIALHFNHRLRGRASEVDEIFCAAVCAALGVKFVRGAWTKAERDRTVGRALRPPSKHGGHKARPTPFVAPMVSEATARAARLEFFERHSRTLWLGHQQDDIAETLLMRLARGSGSAGLAAPRPVQPMPGGRVHLRPLLTLRKAELAAALRRAGAVWREDVTNARGDFFRNRIRGTVVKKWILAARRDALAGAALTRELLDEDDAALEARVDELRPLAPDRSLVLARLAGQPRAIVRRALHRWLLAQPRAGELARRGFEAMLAAVERGTPTRHSLGREGFAVIGRGTLRFERVGKRP